MKWYILSSCLILSLLIIFVMNSTEVFFDRSKIPADDEQKGLKDQVVIRFSHVVAENTPKGLAAQKFAELVQKKTHGKVRVEVYPNGILYSDTDELKALQDGKIQMIAPSYSKLTDIVPSLEVLDLPFIFRDDRHVKAIFTGQVGRQLLGMVDQQQIKGMAFWSNGFKQMTSSQTPLIHPSDFKGQSFRVMPGKVITEQFNLLHAKPVVTSFNEVYQSLENHKVDGQENSISNIYSKRIYKLQKYMTISNHGYLGYIVIINQKFWKSLPPEIQDEIQNAMEETTVWILHESTKMNTIQLKEIKDSSPIQIHSLSNDEKKEWMKVFHPLYRDFNDEKSNDLIKKIQNTK
ncbi:DctP family TRAP transporter solute-binding subunit [Neobacillus terrae]|uniref:DctP family TRAP transporter solute-binding subunit n=1 Tax=Neobacillus terrae TaxID=3034837 RepID=UPI00140BFE4E|nr:DctP family TRAP transporter solute-binding subunit [Neobacillus terrae]NHM29498.1 DctP family TRAP transporter solute-binding subunit [Neobacillus terrae]